MEREQLQQEKEERQKQWGVQVDQTSNARYPDNNNAHFSQPLQIDIGKPSYMYGEVKLDHIGPSHAKVDYVGGDDNTQATKYNKHGNHTPPEKLLETRPQFEVEIQTDPSRKLLLGKQPSPQVVRKQQPPQAEPQFYSYDPYGQDRNDIQHARSYPEDVSAHHIKASMPVVQKAGRMEQPMTAPKPSIEPPRSAEIITRRNVIELNKRPGAGAAPPVAEPEYYRPETTRSMEEMRIQRSTFEMPSPKSHGQSPEPEPSKQYSYVLNRSPNRQSPGRVSGQDQI